MSYHISIDYRMNTFNITKCSNLEKCLVLSYILFCESINYKKLLSVIQ